MPARKSKHYPAVTGPNADTDPVVPANERRVALFIQNTGANPGLVRFAGATQGNGSDMAFPAGFVQRWDQADTTPLESISVSSAAATTWCIIETVAAS